jgi:hypothetical protein
LCAATAHGTYTQALKGISSKKQADENQEATLTAFFFHSLHSFIRFMLDEKEN